MTLPPILRRVKEAVESFDDEPPPGTPLYDPVHVGGVVVVFLVSVGALYWLLWTAFVFEGGIQGKAAALWNLAFRGATLASLGYEGPWERGAFEGCLGNVCAVVLIGVVLWVLRSHWRLAAARGAR